MTKPRWSLLSLEAFRPLAEVMTWARSGKTRDGQSARCKPGCEDWTEYDQTQAYDHLLGHLAAWRESHMKGEVLVNSRSNCLEVGHILFNVMVLAWHDIQKSRSSS